MNDLANIIENLHRQHVELLDMLHRLSAALDILDPPPEVKPVPAAEQIKDGILRSLNAHGPKTEHQLVRILGVSRSLVRKAANSMVEGGALETWEVGKVTHYRIKQESLRIVAGEGIVA
jgi:hypothetical protein